MNPKVKNSLFFLMCFSLIFNMIPRAITVPFISMHMYPHLLFYPAFIGLIYSLYCEYKYHNLFVKFSVVSKYLLLYFVVLFVSQLVGLYNYPYYDNVLAGPISQIEKLPKLIAFLQSSGIEVNEKYLLIGWMFLRQIKNVLADVIFAFGFAYMIYCWYKDDWREGFNFFCKGILTSFGFIAVYCVIEIYFLAGNELAKNILVTINPYIHAIKIVKDVWPPLLSWPGQLRAVFPEPSHMGNYTAYALPVLWYYVYKSQSNKSLILGILSSSYFLFLVCLTKARTATAMYAGLIILIIVFTIFILNERKYFKRLGILIATNMIVFMLAVSFVDTYTTHKQKNIVVKKTQIVSQENMSQNKKNEFKNKTVQIKEKEITIKQNHKVNNSAIKYISDNLGSLASKTKRSNIPRYAYLTASFKTGLDNFWFGVGMGYRLCIFWII